MNDREMNLMIEALVDALWERQCSEEYNDEVSDELDDMAEFFGIVEDLEDSQYIKF